MYRVEQLLVQVSCRSLSSDCTLYSVRAERQLMRISPLGLDRACMSAHSAGVPDSRSYLFVECFHLDVPTQDDNKSKL